MSTISVPIQTPPQPAEQAGVDETAATAALLRCLARSMSWPPQSRAWPIDSSGRTTFLKVPGSIDFQQSKMQTGLYGGNTSLANLPPELHCLILSQLDPVDRVCLALTCKRLMSSALASQLLKVPPWTPWFIHTVDSVPPQNALTLRLAHGWFDKTHYRYCSKCKRILPRDAVLWQNRLRKKKKLPFHIKVRAEKDEWHKLSRKDRYTHIVNTWCNSKQEDSSVFSCTTCMPLQASQFTGDAEKGFSRLADIFEAPVECPCCIEKSITETYKQPHKPKIRPVLWKYTRRILSFVGNAILVVIYLIYLMFKLPVDLVLGLWKKYKRSRAQRGLELFSVL